MDGRLRMNSLLDLDLPFPTPLTKYRDDLFWVALKDKTKTNKAGKMDELAL